MKSIVACTVLLVFACTSMAQDKIDGKFVSMNKDKLTMTDKDGMIETTYKVADTVEITCNGKECKLGDLVKGCLLTITTEKRGDADVIVKIKAKTAP